MASSLSSTIVAGRYRTPFKAWAVGTASSVLDTANGACSEASSVRQRMWASACVRQVAPALAHDEAFTDAVKSLKPQVVQRPRCSSWVCRKSCWNRRRGLCKDCAPDIDVRMSWLRPVATSRRRGRTRRWPKRTRSWARELAADDPGRMPQLHGLHWMQCQVLP